jgi:hypothetical protein
MRLKWGILLVTVAIFYIGFVSESLRAIRHILPILGFCLLVLNKKKTSVQEYTLPFIIISVYGLIIGLFESSIISDTVFIKDSLKYSLLLVGPVVYYLALKNVFNITESDIRVFLKLMILAELARIFLISYNDLGSILTSIKLTQGFKTDTETSGAYLFTFISIYFLKIKDYKFFFLVILILLLNPKRAAIVTLLLVLIVHFFLKKVSKDNRKFEEFLYLITPMFALGFLLYMSTDTFDRFIQSNFPFNANGLTSGRFFLYNDFFNDYAANNWRVLIGYGLGFTKHLTGSVYSYSNIEQIHSDVLLVFYETGILVYTLFYYLLYRSLNKVSHYGFLVYLAAVLNYMFENTLIYFTNTFIILIVIDSLYNFKSEKKYHIEEVR